MVLFDRSWYNRAGVELVMGFCTPQQHTLFLPQCSRIRQGTSRSRDRTLVAD